ncbi:unnamed protein product [Aphanomyces euteiches]
MGKRDAKQVQWTEEVDELTLKEIVRMCPYESPHGKVAVAWSLIAQSLHEFDASISGRACQDHCEKILHEFAKDSRMLQRGSGIEEDESDLVKLKQDVIDRREAAVAEKASKKRKSEEKMDELVATGEALCQEAEERVAKRLKSPRDHPPKLTAELANDPIDRLIEFEKAKHQDDHDYRMERLEFEKASLEVRRQEQEQAQKQQQELSRMLFELISKISNK